jgi:hypothetical protein
MDAPRQNQSSIVNADQLAELTESEERASCQWDGDSLRTDHFRLSGDISSTEHARKSRELLQLNKDLRELGYF